MRTLQIEVRVFAHLRQLLNKSSAPFKVELKDGSNISDLINQLKLNEERSLIVMVNGKRELDDFVLSAGDRVGIFPPVGGG